MRQTKIQVRRRDFLADGFDIMLWQKNLDGEVFIGHLADMQKIAMGSLKTRGVLPNE